MRESILKIEIIKTEDGYTVDIQSGGAKLETLGAIEIAMRHLQSIRSIILKEVDND